MPWFLAASWSFPVSAYSVRELCKSNSVYGFICQFKSIEKGRKQIGINLVELWAIEIGELGGEGGEDESICVV